MTVLRIIFAVMAFLLALLTVLAALVGSIPSGEYGESVFALGMAAFLFFGGWRIWPKKTGSQSSTHAILSSNGGIFIKVPNYSETDVADILPVRKVPSLPGKTIAIPPMDAPENARLSSDFLEQPINLLMHIEYMDAQGQLSSRRITVKKVQQWYDNDFALSAYCHERQANRTFLLSRVQSLIDMETGEFIQNPLTYFAERFDNSSMGQATKAMARCEDELLVLTFISRADGAMRKKERSLIAEYIMKVCSDLHLDIDVLDGEIKRLYCEHDEFRNRAKALKARPVKDVTLRQRP